MSLRHQAMIVVMSSPLVAALIVAILGIDGATVWGVPLTLVCVVVAFAIQWLAFIPAFFLKTERFFDAVGSLTYIGVLVVALVFGADGDPGSLVVGCLVIIWAIRLGTFLFFRVRRAGSDSRFADIIPDFWVFLLTWTLQALWVTITASAALAAIASDRQIPVGSWFALGLIIWLAGFFIEVLADRGKQVFRANPSNEGRFINTGLWSWSRHPNYFGEITLWTGIALMVLPVLEGWQHLTLLSPVFVTFLLVKVSGVEMLERQAQKRWGDDPAYIHYRDTTSVLVPIPPKRV
ncbi:MAG: DUF1295 domain-containing protein [Proteobacteria bacterium]|nr:DUF1295 domain-containing protein [Pseudomonadota bacterium]